MLSSGLRALEIAFEKLISMMNLLRKKSERRHEKSAKTRYCEMDVDSKWFMMWRPTLTLKTLDLLSDPHITLAAHEIIKTSRKLSRRHN